MKTSLGGVLTHRRPIFATTALGVVTAGTVLIGPGAFAARGDDPGSRGANTPNVVHPLRGVNGVQDMKTFRLPTKKDKGHKGTEFRAACGSPVISATPGVARVITGKRVYAWAGPSLVKVYTTKGETTTWYANMESITVEDGQIVQSGDQLGTVGKQGNAEACQLHFQVRDNAGKTLLNPTTWLPANVGKPISDGLLFGNKGFTLVSFNVLGASHTAPGGKNAGMADYDVRDVQQIQKLESVGADVIGLQEFQRKQRADYYNRLKGSFTFFPFEATADTENSILWRQSSFSFVDGGTFAVPYFDGKIRQMPYVQLREKATGRTAWFINVHNPATTRKYKNQRPYRLAAIEAERTLITQLSATGRPVFLTGDLNDIGPAFCPMTREDLTFAAAGGRHEPCQVPFGASIDWIFASGKTAFTSYVKDLSTKGGMSDHPMVIGQAHLAE